MNTYLEDYYSGGFSMPTWFQKQMKKAFYEKDRYQIKILNQCWFFYKKKQSQKPKGLTQLHVDLLINAHEVKPL